MIDFSTKRKLRRIVYSKPVAIFFFGVVGFLGYVTFGMYQTASEAAMHKATAAAKVADLEERERYLTEEIDRLQTVRGLEQEVREKFDVAKEGEKVIVILQEDQAAEDAGQESGEKGIFERIKEWFE